MEMQGEFKKLKPPTFDSEKQEHAETWILNMTKYFQVYENDNNLKVAMVLDLPTSRDLPGMKSQLELTPFGVGIPSSMVAQLPLS